MTAKETFGRTIKEVSSQMTFEVSEKVASDVIEIAQQDISENMNMYTKHILLIRAAYLLGFSDGVMVSDMAIEQGVDILSLIQEVGDE